MSLRLTLVAHAATRATRQAAFPADEPLGPQGLAQATALAGTLGRVDAAWTSPALRAVQTATALGLEAMVDPVLADVAMPLWAGRSLADVGASDPTGLSRWTADPAAAPHGGESVTALLDRASGWLDGISRREGRVLAITHAAFIRAATIIVLDAAPRSFWRLDVEPLSLTTFMGRGTDWMLRRFNSRILQVA